MNPNLADNAVAATPAHPRVAVSGLCFPTLSAVDAIATIGGLGVAGTSMTSTKIRESGADAVAQACRQHGVGMATTTALLRFELAPGADIEEQLALARADIDQAETVGARSVYTLTGRRHFPDWEANASRYAQITAGLVEYAAGKGIAVAVEPTNWLYADLNFVHSLHDALLLGARTGMGTCLDLFHVWTEAELLDDIRKNIELISHVQLSDMTPGMRSLPCRDVLGAGDVPSRHLIEELLAAGYTGVFDLELSGPAIDDRGHHAAAAESVAWLSELLTELGA
ncbi:sugar phosphate isomerase/epimerase family protein [Tomitella biformata]|uniref:sugar phosphate isomerase/epimerase family protein n=1 Tax=Tomitella biformata TaxID=630403 RepID=UPI0004668EF9|nr:sugar phosphate isomerase/epimerase family protein [Tomitella biformata]